MSSFTLYRKSKMGESLKHTLDEMKDSGKINDALTQRINLIFDKVITYLLKV